MDVLDRIREQVEGNPIVLYMKGTPQFPMCGFSARAASALQDCGVSFAYVNVLQDPEIFENLPRYANWPTFPQLYVKGELIGGCDIMIEMYNSGELKELIEGAAPAGGVESLNRTQAGAGRAAFVARTAAVIGVAHRADLLDPQAGRPTYRRNESTG